MFEALDAAVTALDNPSLPAGALAQTVADGLRDIDAASMQLGSARADAGAWLQRLDNVESRPGNKFEREIERLRSLDCLRHSGGYSRVTQ